TVAGLSASMPDLSFVNPGYTLQPRSGASDPFKINVNLTKVDQLGSSRQVTEAPNPVVPDVTINLGAKSAGGRFLFDTGAQMTVISPSLAASLGLSASTQPDGGATLQGVAVPKQAAMYIVNGLVLKRAGGGTVTFTGVPIFVADVGNGLDGVLGMNL